MLFVSTFHERITQLGKNMTNVMDASTNLKESQAFMDFLNVSLLFRFFFFFCLQDVLNIQKMVDYFDGG
jgi:hypothetical protein